MLDSYPTLIYQESTVNDQIKKGYLVSARDRGGFIYAEYADRTVKIVLDYRNSENILEVQPCNDPEFATRLLELNVFREVEYALQMMYDNEITPSTIEWKTIDEV